jgi:hypothetical protein
MDTPSVPCGAVGSILLSEIRAFQALPQAQVLRALPLISVISLTYFLNLRFSELP